MDVSHHSMGNTQEAHLQHHPKQSISSKIRSQTRMSRLSLHFLWVLIFGLLEVLVRATWQLKEIKGRHLTKARVQAPVLLEDGILPYPKYSRVCLPSLCHPFSGTVQSAQSCRCKRRRGYPCTVQRTQQEGTIGQMLNPSAWSQCPPLHSETLISFLCSDVLPSLSGMSKTVQENLEDIRRSYREPPPSSVLPRTEPRPCAC